MHVVCLRGSYLERKIAQEKLSLALGVLPENRYMNIFMHCLVWFVQYVILGLQIVNA
jgi:hypothetical protein